MYLFIRDYSSYSFFLNSVVGFSVFKRCAQMFVVVVVTRYFFIFRILAMYVYWLVIFLISFNTVFLCYVQVQLAGIS